MDNEKKYKDALERAKEIKEIMYSNLSTESCKAVSEYIDAIFPELAESEDERIINAIISFLRMTSLYSSNGCKKPEMIAWLEKQKEQEPAEKQDYSGLNDLERAIHRGFLSTGVENVPVTIIKETAKECLAQMKPAEWSVENCDIITNQVYKAIRRTLASLAVYDEDEELLESKEATLSYYSQQCAEAILKSIRPSWKPSEDEERLINTSISFLKDFADKGYENAVECIDWLKSKLNGNTCE